MLVVVVTDDQRLEEAKHIASKLSAPIVEAFCAGDKIQLVFASDRVYLQSPLIKSGPVYVDFVSGKSAHRRNFGGGLNQPIAKATAINKYKSLQLLDATGGYGADAFVLATLGAHVTIIERSRVLYTLLTDALNIAKQTPETQAITQSMNILCEDSIDYLEQLQPAHYPDVVYMDPMYPQKQKSAAVKAKMQILHHLIGPDMDSEKLLNIACQRAKKRVVVKRPKTAKPISEKDLVGAVNSKNTRYDIYHTKL